MLTLLNLDVVAPYTIPCRLLAVELYNGGDLFAQLDPSGPGLDEKLARRYMAQMATGLAYIHASGVVHSDIKPENVLLHNGVRETFPL